MSRLIRKFCGVHYVRRHKHTAPLPSTPMKTILLILAILLSQAMHAHAQPALFGLGDSSEGYYQLDTTTIQGVGTKAATAWVIISQAPDSQAKKFGADLMLVMFILDCPGRTIQPLAWKAKNMRDQIIAEGVHGKEKRRKPQPESMDERIFQTVCTWKKR